MQPIPGCRSRIRITSLHVPIRKNAGFHGSRLMRLATWRSPSPSVNPIVPITFVLRRCRLLEEAQDMYVLALVTQKGGSGKSTLAVGLAVAAMENGERVAFVEADPQGTISKWQEGRGNPFPRVVRVADPAELERGL